MLLLHAAVLFEPACWTVLLPKQPKELPRLIHRYRLRIGLDRSISVRAGYFRGLLQCAPAFPLKFQAGGFQHRRFESRGRIGHDTKLNGVDFAGVDEEATIYDP
jgi:hypothetical protein